MHTRPLPTTLLFTSDSFQNLSVYFIISQNTQRLGSRGVTAYKQSPSEQGLPDWSGPVRRDLRSSASASPCPQPGLLIPHSIQANKKLCLQLETPEVVTQCLQMSDVERFLFLWWGDWLGDFVGGFVVLVLFFSKAALLQSSVFSQRQQSVPPSCQATKISLVNHLLCYRHNHKGDKTAINFC